MFPRRIVSATLLDNSTPRAGTAYDAVILRGDSDASSGYVLRVGQEVVVSSEDPDDPFLARVGKLIYTPSEKPPWSFTCRWYYKIKEVAADAVKKNLSKHPPNAVFISSHIDTNPIDTIVRPCEMIYVSGWQAQLRWPKQRDLMHSSSFYCCGSYDPAAKTISGLRADDITGKRLVPFPQQNETGSSAALKATPSSAEPTPAARSSTSGSVPHALPRTEVPAMRFDFGTSDARRSRDDDLLSLHYLGTRPRAADGHVLPRIGASFQADVPDSDGNLARPKTALPAHAARSWSPLWLAGTRLIDSSSGSSTHSDTGGSRSSSVHDRSLDCATELAEFLSRAERVSVDWRVGMRVGVPRPRGGATRIEPGVLLSWQRGSPARLTPPVAVPLQPSAPGQTLLSASPAPGFAFVAVLSSSAVLQVPLSALSVLSSDMIVTQENALLILTRCGGDVSLGLREITRLASLASSTVSMGTTTMHAVRTHGHTLMRALKLLAGCTEIAVVPRAPLLAPLVSTVSAAAATACSQGWAASQQVAFAYSFNRFGKNFQLYRVPGKTSRDCVRYYYSQKHSRMLISGMGFSSRNPSESRWRSPAVATAASLSGEDREAISELGWTLGLDEVGSTEARNASAAAEASKSPENAEEAVAVAPVAPAAHPDQEDLLVQREELTGALAPGPGSSAQLAGTEPAVVAVTQDRVELATRSSRPVLYVRGSALYDAAKPSERAALVQLATAVICMGGTLSDVRTQLDGFVLCTYDTVPPPNSRLPFDTSELNELRSAQKPRSALDPLNATRACSSCRKTSTNPMVCCNPQCCIVSCDVCFKLEAAKVETSTKFKPMWKLSRNNAWWLCLGCCMVLPTRGEMQRRQRVDDACRALRRQILETARLEGKIDALLSDESSEEDFLPTTKRKREVGSNAGVPAPSALRAPLPQQLQQPAVTDTTVTTTRARVVQVMKIRRPVLAAFPTLPGGPRGLPPQLPLSSAASAPPPSAPLAGRSQSPPSAYVQGIIQALPHPVDHARFSILVRALSTSENQRDAARAVIAFLVSRAVALNTISTLEPFFPPSERGNTLRYVAEFVLLFSPLIRGERRALLEAVASGSATVAQLTQFMDTIHESMGPARCVWFQ